MKTEHHTLTKTWVVAALASLCCILWGSAIPMIKTGYRLLQVDTTNTASQIVFAGIRFALAGLFVLIFASIQEKKVNIARWKDSKICSSCLPCSDCWTVFFLLYRRGTYIWSERWNHYRFRKFYRNPNVMFDRTK